MARVTMERAAATWLSAIYEEAVDLLSNQRVAMHRITEQLLIDEEIDGFVVEAALGLIPEPISSVA